MGKTLGKKARKFARKNLQSVAKRRSKQKALVFKRKSGRPSSSVAAASLENGASAEKNGQVGLEQHTKENPERNAEATPHSNFDDIFSEDDENLIEDVSDSDGSLEEDPECPYISRSDKEEDSEGNSHSDFGQNKDILAEIAKQKRKLDKLRKKDPKFSEFLEARRADLENSKFEDIYSDEESDTSSQGGAEITESLNPHDKVLTSCTIDVWSWLVTEQPNGPALSNLLNSFRAACHYGIESDNDSSKIIPDKQVFSKVVTFVLSEADAIFRRLLGVSGSCSKENILKLTNTPVWQLARPLLKSYLRSCLFLLNQVTDNKMLVFILSRLRESIVFFAAFPSLAGRLIKISVRLWATDDESLSLPSFYVIRDISSQLGSECLDTCLTRIYKAFIAYCKFAESANLKHVGHLKNSVVELYSLDIQKSYPKVVGSVHQLADILRQALITKKKKELKKISSWHFISCINLFVTFITCNIKDHELQPLLFSIIELIRGIAHLFSGPRYLPLRFKCVQMLNHLSLSSGIFIPVVALVLDCLEYEGCSKSNTRRKPLDLASVLKVPKQFLKSQDFHEESIRYAIELLASHFSQWSSHISFPELATIPLILLKRFHEKATIESLRRPVKRLVDQLEMNSKLIQRKRDEVAFSPNDAASVNSFLQLERSSTVPFTQYYTSVQRNSTRRI